MSQGSDELQLVGKYLDFSAKDTYLGEKAWDYLTSFVPSATEMVDMDYKDEVMAWRGPLRLAGFVFPSEPSVVLDLTK